MNARILVVAAAAALACGLTSVVSAYAKDDPAAEAAAREEKRKKLLAEKKYPTADMAYVLDSSKVDSRWAIKTMGPPADPDQGQMFNAVLNPRPSDPTAAITVNLFRCVHKNMAKRVEYSHEFKAWGKSVKVSDWKTLAEGYFENWMLECSEPLKDKSKSARARSVGPAQMWCCACGTDKEEKVRMRMDWYFWTLSDKSGSYTYWAESKMSDKLWEDVATWAERLDDLIKNLKELK